MDFSIVIAGEAGQGLDTMSRLLSKVFFYQGYSLYCSQDYMSRVRGGHNFMEIRVSLEKIYGPSMEIDVLLSLNQEGADLHRERLKRDGIILCDGTSEKEKEGIERIPATERAKELGNERVANTLFMGALLKVIGMGLKPYQEILSKTFQGETLNLNREALKEGYELGKQRFSLPLPQQRRREILLSGNQAMGLGAACAGVKFYTAYPMSPSTGIMNYLASKQSQLGIVVEQAEDEIGAINMAIGAWYSGIRAMTGTSGGGFSLMNEGLGLAGVSETPLVVANVQRPGPATGMATRTEQSDLLFVINSSQGEFPLIVLAPRNVEDAFYLTFQAFDLADKYQLPVILLSDQFLADSIATAPEFSLEEISNHSYFIKEGEVKGAYERYKITEDGISPRAYPGFSRKDIVLFDSHEHDTFGRITELEELRREMVDKRAKKLERFQREDKIPPLFLGEEECEALLVGWGSTYGPLVEAKNLLEEEGLSVGLISFNQLSPLPTEEIEERASTAKTIIIVENNQTGQFARLLRMETGIQGASIRKYDGRPFRGAEIAKRIKREVLNHGHK